MGPEGGWSEGVQPRDLEIQSIKVGARGIRHQEGSSGRYPLPGRERIKGDGENGWVSRSGLLEEVAGNELRPTFKGSARTEVSVDSESLTGSLHVAGADQDSVEDLKEEGSRF